MALERGNLDRQGRQDRQEFLVNAPNAARRTKSKSWRPWRLGGSTLSVSLTVGLSAARMEAEALHLGTSRAHSTKLFAIAAPRTALAWAPACARIAKASPQRRVELTVTTVRPGELGSPQERCPSPDHPDIAARFNTEKNFLPKANGPSQSCAALPRSRLTTQWCGI
jgi:hypothetical protein